MKPFFYKSYVIVGLGTPLLPPNSTRPPSPLQEPWLAPRQLALHPPGMNSISWQVGTAKEDIPEFQNMKKVFSIFCSILLVCTSSPMSWLLFCCTCQKKRNQAAFASSRALACASAIGSPSSLDEKAAARSRKFYKLKAFFHVWAVIGVASPMSLV